MCIEKHSPTPPQHTHTQHTLYSWRLGVCCFLCFFVCFWILLRCSRSSLALPQEKYKSRGASVVGKQFAFFLSTSKIEMKFAVSVWLFSAFQRVRCASAKLCKTESDLLSFVDKRNSQNINRWDASKPMDYTRCIQSLDNTRIHGIYIFQTSIFPI